MNALAAALLVSLAAAALTAAHSTAALRVLVADGDESVRDVLGRILRRAGHQVTTVGSGAEALAQCDLQHFDLLFTDLSLPGVDGSTLIAELRARDPELAIVIVTGWGHVEDLPQVPGARAVIAKPFDLAEVHRVVAEIGCRSR